MPHFSSSSFFASVRHHLSIEHVTKDVQDGFSQRHMAARVSQRVIARSALLYQETGQYSRRSSHVVQGLRRPDRTAT